MKSADIPGAASGFGKVLVQTLADAAGGKSLSRISVFPEWKRS